ncbi:Myb/SANT-like domain [Dillenia turbinata]|uniref:Myb/SANT-like domain n=1 Tax=Dillenia turbinata TaxID=194707 RepID=A0AAN8VFX5_9MAGN
MSAVWLSKFPRHPDSLGIFFPTWAQNPTPLNRQNPAETLIPPLLLCLSESLSAPLSSPGDDRKIHQNPSSKSNKRSDFCARMDHASKEYQNGEAKAKSWKSKKRQWTTREDEALIEALHEIYSTGWKTENGNFKGGYTTALEKALKSKLPGCNLKASPHIESRLKILKKHCNAISDIRESHKVHWNEEEHTVVCEDDDVWNEWVKDHPDAKALKNKVFPYYEDLCIVFGRNRMNGKGAETVMDAVEEVDGELGNNNIPLMAVAEEADVDASQDDAEAAQSASASRPYRKRKRLSASNASLERSISSDDASSGLGEIAKVMKTYLETTSQQFSILSRLLGSQEAAEKDTADRRRKVNGELKRIQNLNLQARLRAASLIVSDPAKVDLFLSLTDDDRREWVSMLLTGLL